MHISIKIFQPIRIWAVTDHLAINMSNVFNLKPITRGLLASSSLDGKEQILPP